MDSSELLRKRCDSIMENIESLEWYLEVVNLWWEQDNAFPLSLRLDAWNELRSTFMAARDAVNAFRK